MLKKHGEFFALKLGEKHLLIKLKMQAFEAEI